MIYDSANDSEKVPERVSREYFFGLHTTILSLCHVIKYLQ